MHGGQEVDDVLPFEGAEYTHLDQVVQALSNRAGGRRHVLEGLTPPLQVDVHGLAEQRRLVVEVVVERGLGHAGRFHDGPHRRRAVPVLGEQFRRHFENPCSNVVGFCCWSGLGHGHTER